MQKATLEVLLARKQKNQTATTEIEISSIGLSFTVEKIPLVRVLAIMDRYPDKESAASQFGMFKELVYTCIPMFRNKELLAAYEVHEPSDIVTCVLEDNIAAITEMANGILNLYGLNNGQAVNELKN